MTPFVNKINFFKEKNIYIMTFRIAHKDMLVNGLVFKYARGR